MKTQKYAVVCIQHIFMNLAKMTITEALKSENSLYYLHANFLKFKSVFRMWMNLTFFISYSCNICIGKQLTELGFRYL